MHEQRTQIITAHIQECIDRVFEVKNFATDDELRSLINHLVIIAWSQGGEDASWMTAASIEMLIASATE